MRRQKVAIVGAGFTGLSAGISLLDNNFDVKIFESKLEVGGLAGGFEGNKNWNWELDYFYHHIFTSDKSIIDMADKVGEKIYFYKPITASLIKDKQVQLDSPVSLLRFGSLSLFARLRMGLGLGLLKLISNGLFLERYQTSDFLPVLIGKEGYKLIWERLLIAKFGSMYKKVNMAWFWSRVAKRSQKLGYFEGGFQSLANKMVDYVKKHGGEVELNCKIYNIIENKNDQTCLINGEKFDKVIITTPLPIAEKITNINFNWPKIDYLSAQVLIVELKKSLMKNYWLNILNKKWPFLVVVEHTNMINKKEYDGKVIVYIGNYLENDNKNLKLSKGELLDKFLPFIKRINPKFEKSWISNYWIFQESFAQPVFPTNYSKLMPKSYTENIYLANMSMVYPYDRGTNYAVKMGMDIAEKICKTSFKQ